MTPLFSLGFHRLLPLLSCCLLAACSANNAEQASSALVANAYKPPQIEVKRMHLAEYSTGRAVGTLSAKDRRRITDIIEFHADQNIERLHLALSGGTAELAQSVSRHAVSKGVLPGNVHRLPREVDLKGAGGWGMVISFDTYVAIPPDCEKRVLRSQSFGANRTDRGFGCATLNDLALTVADPFDLIGRPHVRLTQARRPSNAITAIRSGPATPAAN